MLQASACRRGVVSPTGGYKDVTEHQSWTQPGGRLLLSLYQRQCLTVNRDAYPGHWKEVWVAELTDGLAVLLVNKVRITSNHTRPRPSLECFLSTIYREIPAPP